MLTYAAATLALLRNRSVPAIGLAAAKLAEVGGATRLATGATRLATAAAAAAAAAAESKVCVCVCARVGMRYTTQQNI